MTHSFPLALRRRPCLWRWLLAACLGLLAGVAQGLVLEHAEVRAEVSPQWRAVALPDKWQDSRPGYGGSAWYRLQVDLAAPDAMLGIYLRRACNNAWIYANGDLIYSGGGPLDGPRVLRRCHFPVLASWPRAAQKAGRNELLIRVYSEPAGRIASEQRKGHLSPVRVDSWQALVPVYEQEYFIRLIMPRVTAAILAFAALTLLVLWWRFRRESIYLHFGLAMIAGSLGAARVFVTEPGVDNLTVERIIPGILLLSCFSIMGVVQDIYSNRSRLYYLWAALSLLAWLAVTLVPADYLAPTAVTAYGVGALTLGGGLLELARRVRQDRAGVKRLFYAIVLVIMVSGLHDYLVQVRVLDYTDRPLIQIVFPLLLLGFMMRLITRHADALAVAERSRQELADQVSLISREIEASYARSVALEKDRAAREERERIARDLHDDLGARLLTLVHGSADEGTSAHAREALSDLRLLIGNLNVPPGPLADAVSDWRAEAAGRCEAAGRRLDWQTGALPDAVLGTRQKITLGRLVREAVTNILKHTASAAVHVAVRREDYALVIDVTDDDASAPVAAWTPGIGLRSLQLRASQIGAQLVWEDLVDATGHKAGTRLRCRLPLGALSANDIVETEP